MTGFLNFILGTRGWESLTQIFLPIVINLTIHAIFYITVRDMIVVYNSVDLAPVITLLKMILLLQYYEGILQQLRVLCSHANASITKDI